MTHGDEGTEGRDTGDEPDDNDPAVIRQRRIEDLEFHDRVAASLPALLEIITHA